MKNRLLLPLILFIAFCVAGSMPAAGASSSIWPAAVTPGFSYDNPQAIDLGLKFRSDTAGTVTAVRFFKAVGATGTHVGRLWTASGTKLAEATFTNETASGWQTATFAAPVTIQAATTYIVSYYVADGNRRFSDTFDYFAAAGADSSPLHALASGVDGSNGVYSVAGGVPNQSYRSSNYWVDLVFAPGADTVPPTVSAVVPSNSSTGLPVSTIVTVTFNEAMNASTINAGTIQLLDSSSAIVAATISYDATARTATLAPMSALSWSSTYTLRLPAGGVKDAAGNALAAVYSSSFTTELLDVLPPTVNTVVPANGTTGVLVSATIAVTFSEAMDSGTISTATVQLLNPSNAIIPATVSYNPANRTATLTPAAALSLSTTYMLRLPAGGVKDVAGNAMAAAYSSSFTTMVTSQSYSIWPAAITPGFSYDNPQAIDLGLKFRADVAGSVTGVRFFKATGATGTHVGRLWTAGGTKVAEVTFTNESASGWQTATFAAPVQILAGTTYVVSYYLADGNRRFSDTFDYFATTGVDTSPLHALASGVDGLNGVYSGTGGLPNVSYRSSNYWVDIVFSPGAPGSDTIAPTVNFVSPTNGSTSVSVGTTVAMTFSEPMDASTITTATVQLLDPSSAVVSATVGYDATSRSATLAPTAPLKLSTIYTLRLPAGGVKDMAGNALAAVHTSSFTTESPDATPPMVTAVAPANGATGVLVGATVSVAFSEAMDPGTVDAGTVQLLGPSNAIVSATVSFNPTSRTATLAPTASLEQATNYTILLPAGGVTDVAGNALAAAYDSSFTTEAQDVVPPTVIAVKPVDGASRLRLATNVTAYFSEGMDPDTISTLTFVVRDASDNLLPASVTYSTADHSATLVPVAGLSRSTTYRARVLGGLNGVKDANGNALSGDATWSFSTEGERPPVDQAPGGPILVVSSSSNLFTRYSMELLRTEGFNEYDNADISEVTPQLLAGFDIAILGDIPLTDEQVATFTEWVTGGGRLIAMRPDKKLAGLLGLTDTSSTLSDRYLAIDTSRSPGNGIVEQTLQFHGTADLYEVSGATALARLYSGISTATPSPAVTLRSVGSNGGQAAAFTFDLARSIVYTHQGNPAWQVNHVNPFQPYGTALDLFYDAAKPWIDFDRISIPQADEQQRFLANLILGMNSGVKPLPRFWYFPKGKKAVIVLTGDDHTMIYSVTGNTKLFFERHEAQSTAGCSVADWECVRSSSYIDVGAPGARLDDTLTDAEAADYTRRGFEVGLHADAGGCSTWASYMPAQYFEQLDRLLLHYASSPVQGSERSHCYSWFGYDGGPTWNGYAGGPEVEADLGIRFDTNIAYNPSAWATINPGYQMGSAMMMRFAQVDTSGAMTSFLDIYNAGTQITDDNNQGASTARGIVDSFLDAANGQQGFYGGIVVNMHSDNYYNWSYDGSDQVVVSAQARGVPVVSGQQMLDWLDGRNNASFGSITWDGARLGFTVSRDSRARNLQAMLPVAYEGGVLSEITWNGSPISYTSQTIKGVEYAFFPAEVGSFTASYSPDATPPTVDGIVPADGMTGVPVTTTVNVIFSEVMDSVTINSSTIRLEDSNGVVVPASVSYNPITRTATLAPVAALNESTLYTLRLPVGGVKDVTGTPLAVEHGSTFATAEFLPQFYSIWPNAVTPGFSYDNPLPVELGLKFRSDVEGTVTGVRFFKAAGATGTHIGRLWTAGGAKLAEVTFTNETASGWQSATFAAPVPILASTTYVVSYYLADGNRRFSDTFDSFTAIGVDSSPLHALTSGVDGPNGVYSETGGFPNQSYRSSNYWVDLVFSAAE